MKEIKTEPLNTETGAWLVEFGYIKQELIFSHSFPHMLKGTGQRPIPGNSHQYQH